MPQEVVVVVAYNWYPLVTVKKEVPWSSLCKDSPLETLHKRYAFIFEPFLNHKPSPLIFFTNLFPHFLQAGKLANAGLNQEQMAFIDHVEGMKTGLLSTLEAINPALQLRGEVILGAQALFALFPDLILTDYMKNLVKMDTTKTNQALLALEVSGKETMIPNPVNPCESCLFLIMSNNLIQ